MQNISTNDHRCDFLLARTKFVYLLLGLVFSIPTLGQQVKNITRNQTFSTIQAAINDAATIAGDVIEVSEGTYNEHLLINKAITLQGVSTGAIIKAPYSSDNSNANTVLITTGNVTLKNLTITRDYGSTIEEWNACTVNQGINFNSRPNVRLENLIVKDNRNAIYCSNSQNATIINCVVENNRTGIHFTNNVSGLLMTQNIVSNNFTHGVLFNFDTNVLTATNAQVYNNSITGNWYSQLNFQRAAGAETTNIGDLTGASFACNWYGVQNPTINAIPANEPGYSGQIPSQFGGSDPELGNRFLVGTLATSIPSYTPFLANGTDISEATGFQPKPNQCTPAVNLNRNTYFTSIQAAINDAATVAGDVIEVSEGIHSEHLLINKAITVQGISTAAIIKAPYSSDNSNENTVLITTGNVTLKNLTITRDYGSTIEEWNACTVNQGINFNSRPNVRLENLIVKDNRNAIYCSNSQNATIINCVVENNRTGIHFTNDVSGLVLIQNIVRNNFTHGVLFNFDTNVLTATNAQVHNNSITNNWYSQLNFQRAAGAGTTNIGDLTGASFSCNWYGVPSPTINAIPANEPGYAVQVPSQFGGNNPDLSDRYLVGTLAASIPQYTPFLEDGTDISDATGFQPKPSQCTPVININKNTYFATIQAAINDATTVAGDTIVVGEGIFAENITVSKSLVILGPNAAINPNTETRVAEAILRPAVREISSDNSTSGTIIRVAGTGHLDVTIKGFTIDGNNPSLTGGRMLNGVEVHTGAGIVNSTGSFDVNPGGADATMIIQNNIIKNLERYGVLADGTTPVKALAGTDVSYNKFDNIPSGDNFGGGRGRAATFAENHYGRFAHNVITRANVGWQNDNYYRASPGLGTIVEHNEIHTYYRGILHNLQYTNATPIKIAHNTITKETSGDFAAATENFGIELASIRNSVSALVDSNEVSGMKYGILLWNIPSTGIVKVSNGTLTANQYGIYATSNDPLFGGANNASNAIISGVNVVNSTIAGIAINDSINNAATTLQITDSTIVSGGVKGLVLNGTNAAISGTTLNNTTFVGQTGNYIELINSISDIDGSNITFGIKKASVMTQSERQALEQKLVHKPDNPILGKICLPNAATLSVKAGSPNAYCIGGSTILVADINGVIGPFTLVYTDGATQTTVNNYVSGADIPVSASSTKSYSIVSIADSIGCSTSTGFTDVVTVIVNPIPTKPVITPVSATICFGESTTLTATGCAGGSFFWTGGLTGSSITVSPTTTQGYKVACEQSGCTSDSSNVATITVNPVPSTPSITATNETICEGSSTTLTASACTGGTLSWTGGLTGSSIIVSPTSTTQYKVACTQLTCTSDSSEVLTIIVNLIPEKPSITPANITICRGASTMLSADGCIGGTLNWTGGLTGSDIIVSPTNTKAYKVACTQSGCTSDSSNVATVTVNPIPTKPIITSDSTTICNGQTLQLRGSCTTGTVVWSPSGTGGTRVVSSPGTYSAVCVSSGCTSESSTIVITSGTCRFIAINPASPVVCPGKSITLTTAGCNGGSVTWSGGATGAGTSITVSPTTATTYTATCSLGSTASTTVSIATTNTVVATDIYTGTLLVKAIQTIQSARIIGDNGTTPLPNVTYQAGNSITLQPGFMVENGTVFKAEIQGCN
ncbi:right-handed parallel beta-helix repeat-containing protein [Emticicia soli]|uniref:Right-handed parallel beta-helix repeat-containing protein n=1 Tax=Emticicia soli TaxID=2027878 RepID=A0ABW5J3M3_9BACT